MRSCIRAVIFDLGGVFFMWPKESFFSEWAQRLLLIPEDFHRLLWYGPDIEAANIGLITAEEYCRRSAERLNVAESIVREIVIYAFYSDNIDDALVKYVGQLRKRLHVSALTNTWSFGRNLIEKHGLTKLFDLIVTSAEEGISKPDVRIFETTICRLGVSATETIYIDDTIANVQAAEAIGMHGILFSNTEQMILEIEALLA